MQLKILRTEKPTSDSVSLYFEHHDVLKNYKAGQHGNFSFLIDGVVYQRTYSFHTWPHDREPGITVRAVNGGVVSNFLQTAEGNATISLDGITGEFFLEPSKDVKRHLIMFAGGSGITPIFSMLQALLHEEPQSTVSLIYVNKSYARIIFKNALHALEASYPQRLNVYHVITQNEDLPADFPVFYRGRLSGLIIRKLLREIRSKVDRYAEYYLCGPNGLMDIIASAISATDPGNPQIKREVFYIQSKPNEFDFSGLPDRKVVLQREGVESIISVRGGQSILQAALEQGSKLPFSCLEGQCGTCRARLVSGEVKLRKNHILTDEELKEGQILLCQGFPVSDGITIRTG